MSGNTDIHCHILPGVDDGSKNLRESVTMLRAAAESGIGHIYCTPHCRGSRFDRAAIDEAYGQLKPYADDYGIQLDLGYEVFWRNLIDIGLTDREAIRSLRLGNSRYLLLEFSSNEIPSLWRNMVQRVQLAGVHPIIAHPERYAEVQRDIGMAEQFIEAGCKLQVSANYLENGRFDKRKRTAEKLFARDMVDFLASDAHCPEDYGNYRKALAKLR